MVAPNLSYKKENRIVPSKISEQKMYEYIKKIEIDGYTRVRAYAEVIDPAIYDMTPSAINHKLDYLRTSWKGFDELREMVLAEQKDWSLRRSSMIQDKAVNLLANLLDKANELATKPDVDAKELNMAISTLKTVMPAFTAVGNNANQDTNTTDKRARASRYIH